MNIAKAEKTGSRKSTGQYPRSLAVVQTGGSSAVINSTLAGVVQEAQKAGQQVWGYQNAFEGLLADAKYELSYMEHIDLQRLRATPGAFLGSSRLFLTKKLFEEIPRKLVQQGMDALVMIGGNGTMYAAQKIRESVEAQGLMLQVIGAPKTVDNDLEGIEYAPGFGSAARYIAQAVLDISIDLETMKTFEQVRIIEVMGRSAGWLAAASALARHGEATAPHLIYLPEQNFDEEDFLREIRQVYEHFGFAVAVIGEGIHDASGVPIGNAPFAELTAGSKIYGGASAYLADMVGQTLGVRARCQDLTMAQRSFGPMRSSVDEKLAYKIGCSAVQALNTKKDGNMVCCHPQQHGYTLLPLGEVGGKEKCVPEKFYNLQHKQVTQEFLDWLRPIVGPWEYKYLSLADFMKKESKTIISGGV